MKRKKENNTKKILLTGGALLGLGLLFSSFTQRNKTATYLPAPGNTTPGPDQTTPTTNTTPTAAPVTTTPTLTNFQQLQNYFRTTGVPFNLYTDRIEATFNYNGYLRKFQFWSNDRFIFYWKDSSGAWKVSTKGNYASGGRVLTITDGSKKGQIKNGQDVLTNIKNAL